MTDAEIEADIASDPDEAGMVVDWGSGVSVELPKPKADLHMRIDRDVLEFFRRTGRGYQTRINAVLRAPMSNRQSTNDRRTGPQMRRSRASQLRASRRGRARWWSATPWRRRNYAACQLTV